MLVLLPLPNWSLDTWLQIPSTMLLSTTDFMNRSFHKKWCQSKLIPMSSWVTCLLRIFSRWPLFVCDLSSWVDDFIQWFWEVMLRQYSFVCLCLVSLFIKIHSILEFWYLLLSRYQVSLILTQWVSIILIPLHFASFTIFVVLDTHYHSRCTWLCSCT